MLKINPQTALRWARDNYGFSGGEIDTNIRLRECLLCGNRKHAVSFNAEKGVVYCFRCRGALSILEFVKRSTGAKNLVEATKALKAYGELTFSFSMNAETPEQEEQFLKELLAKAAVAPAKPGGLSTEFFSSDWQTPAGKLLRAYGESRGLSGTLLDSGRVGYFRRGSLAGRLCFLVFEDGRPVFAVGRAIRPEVSPKYLYPKAAECGGLGAGAFVYRLDLVPEGAEIPVTEGAISAECAGPFGVAMLGNALTEIQAVKLKAKRPAAVVILREEGIDPAHSMASASLLWGKDVPAFVADLVGGDTNDNPEQLPGVLAAARPFDEFSFLEAKLFS